MVQLLEKSTVAVTVIVMVVTQMMQLLLIDLVLGRTCVTLMGMVPHSVFFQLASPLQNLTNTPGNNMEETSKLMLVCRMCGKRLFQSAVICH
jgi:hypothetical protein